jgi:hypothetical protein
VTLIGAFITSAGIVIGADSAMLGIDQQIGALKTCQTGRHTVAAIAGAMHIAVPEIATGIMHRLPAYNTFREGCSWLSVNQRPLQE